MRKFVKPLVQIIIVFLCIWQASCCNNFDDFCDKAEEQFEEVRESNSLTDILNRRLRERRSIAPSWEKKEAAQKVTETLDYLFAESTYDKRFRPGFGGPPTNIEVNIFIRSMGPVDESLQKFTFDCYFRQKWTDLRLVFNSTNLQELPMNWQFLSKIWRPDTYFLNGMNSYLHKIAVPNRFIRIAPNGRISYSQRLTVTARCQMNLRKFPLDTQACPLEIGSFGFDDDDLTYRYYLPQINSHPITTEYNLSWCGMIISKKKSKSPDAGKIHGPFVWPPNRYKGVYTPMYLNIGCLCLVKVLFVMCAISHLIIRPR